MSFAFASGISTAEIATFLQITRRGVEKWLANNRARVKPTIDMLQLWAEAKRTKITNEIIDDWAAELRKLDGAARDSLIKALVGSDKRLSYEAGKELRDRVLGTPKSTVEHAGRISHTMTHTIDASVLQLLEKDILRDAELSASRERLQLTGKVIHVEPEPAV